VELYSEIQLHSFAGWAERDGNEGLKQCWLHDHDQAGEPWQDRQGRCELCAGTTLFKLTQGADRVTFDTREQIVCSGCTLNARVRAAFWLASLELRGENNTNVYLTEQASPAFSWAQRHLPARAVHGSEFESDDQARRRLATYLRDIGGWGDIQYQDVTQLSHQDAQFDVVVSMDVLEHVREYVKAIREFARVLKPGGTLIATFPFNDKPSTLVRARLNDGAIEHLLEPEYHGDPLGAGILCWYHFGWDVLDVCRAAGFKDARMVMPWSPASELRYGLWTLVARR
jgi:SAM-dependent methyltransferase